MTASDHMLELFKIFLHTRGQWYGPRRPAAVTLRHPKGDRGDMPWIS